MIRTLQRALSARVALLITITLFWINFLTTWRWAHVPGSIHGPRQSWYALALMAVTIAALTPAHRFPSGSLVGIARVGLAVAYTWLAICFVVWFPPSVWGQIPLFDNFPARFQTTIDGIALLKRGAAVGWQWDFLGGYHTSSDLTVTLSAVAWPFVELFGPQVGFHAVHLALFLAIPLLVYADLRTDNRDGVAPLAAALACLATSNFSYFLLRSGDTNSLAAVVASGLTIVASHAAARGVRGAGVLLVGSLGMVTYCHAGFVVYTVLYLLVEAACYRDAGRLRRALVATAGAVLIGLPLTWESFVYPDYFRFNNVLYETDGPWPWLSMLRKVYYNVEMTWLPHRWFNDFPGLTSVAVPIVAFVAWKERGRARFHAWALLVTSGLLVLNLPEFGYAFLRPIHMLAFFIGPVLAAFAVRWSGSRARAVTLTAACALFLQVWLLPVPHIRGVHDAAGPLVEAVAGADGALILVENHYHRDMIADPSVTSPPTPFPGNFEVLLPPATGRRLYAGIWDGWQWSPYRSQMLANGAWDGRAISAVPHDEFLAELGRWGVRHLFVWSEQSARYLAADPRLREDTPPTPRWRHFIVDEGDSRDVVTGRGQGRLLERDPLGARVRLSAVKAGDRIVLRTNYHPAWTARANGRPVKVINHDGQLALITPVDGSVDIMLSYPRRPWLLVVAATGLLVAGGTVEGWNRRARSASR